VNRRDNFALYGLNIFKNNSAAENDRARKMRTLASLIFVRTEKTLTFSPFEDYSRDLNAAIAGIDSRCRYQIARLCLRKSSQKDITASLRLH
jgi:hypothetical protein